MIQNRRDFFKTVVSGLAFASLGSLRSLGEFAKDISPRIWNIDQEPRFVADGDTIFDLSATLPANMRQGGTFSLDPSGMPLPEGMTLDPRGFLHVGAAQPGVAEGLVFSYTEPA